MPESLAEEIADMLWHIQGNYQREGSGPGSRFEGQRLEVVQAEAVIRTVRATVAEEIRTVWPDTLGMWDVNQAIAARTTKAQILKRVTRGGSDA